MKRTLRAGSILIALALSIVGCDPAEPQPEEPPKAEEPTGSMLGPPPPAPAVDPSRTPSIPADANREMLPAEKEERAKLESEKTGAKSEPPK